MILTILAMPLLSFVIISLCGRFIGRFASLVCSLASSHLALFLSLINFFHIVVPGNTSHIDLGLWMDLGVLKLSFGLIWDPLSSMLSLLITFISSLILSYSVTYMAEDPHQVKFFSFLNFFTFSMLLLVLSSNYVQLFLGWELVGLASYMLINFWHSRSLANSGGIKAILFNRMGDISFLVYLALIFLVFRSFDFSVIFATIPSIIDKTFSLGIDISVIELLAFFLALAAMAKSAQLLFHPWLPDAMEGPTPVSALLHSATMVTAGIFLIMRSSPLFSFAPKVSIILALLAFFTSSLSSFSGLLQYDIKRIIAFSTCSQLGFIMVAVALGNHPAALFHLFNHAFFKALLFLSAGSIIHATGTQDIRKMGGLLPVLPFSYFSFFLGSLALSGIPFLSGFYSKDLILESTFSLYFASSFPIYLLSALSAFFSSFYSFRLIYFVFFSSPNFQNLIIKSLPNRSQLTESDMFLFLPLVLLSVLSIFSGFLLASFFVAPTLFWKNSLFNLPLSSGNLDSEFISFLWKILPSISSLLGLAAVYILYSPMSKEFHNLYKSFMTGVAFLSRKFYFDSLYNYFLARGTANFSLFTSFTLLDKGFWEHMGPFGLHKIISLGVSLSKRWADTPFIYQALLFLLSFLLFLFVLFLLPFLSLIPILLFVALLEFAAMDDDEDDIET